MSWEAVAGFLSLTVTLLIMTVTLAYRLGIQSERLRQLRVEHDELKVYSHTLGHSVRNELNEQIAGIKLYLAKHVKNGIGEL